MGQWAAMVQPRSQYWSRALKGRNRRRMLVSQNCLKPILKLKLSRLPKSLKRLLLRQINSIVMIKRSLGQIRLINNPSLITLSSKRNQLHFWKILPNLTKLMIGKTTISHHGKKPRSSLNLDPRLNCKPQWAKPLNTMIQFQISMSSSLLAMYLNLYRNLHLWFQSCWTVIQTFKSSTMTSYCKLSICSRLNKSKGAGRWLITQSLWTTSNAMSLNSKRAVRGRTASQRANHIRLLWSGSLLCQSGLSSQFVSQLTT